MTDNWSDLHKRFRIAFLRRDGTVEQFASQIPAHRATVYRIVSNEEHHPSKALRAAIEALVKTSQVRQSTGSDSE